MVSCCGKCGMICQINPSSRRAHVLGFGSSCVCDWAGRVATDTGKKFIKSSARLGCKQRVKGTKASTRSSTSPPMMVISTGHELDKK
jgi:hypothetical protein